MKYVEMRVSWSEDHHKDVLIEVPDDFDGRIYENVEDDAIETAKFENRFHPHESIDDTNNYRVKVADD
jgi:hypothetical protein